MSNVAERLFQCFQSGDPLDQLRALERIKVPKQPDEDGYDRRGDCDRCGEFTLLNEYSHCAHCEKIVGCFHD